MAQKRRVVVVTGAGGLVGRHALEYLMGYHGLGRVDAVVATDLVKKVEKPWLESPVSYSYVRADLCDRPSLGLLTSAIRRLRPDEVVVLDIGALFRYRATWDELYQANVVGQKNLVECVVNPLQYEVGADVRVIFWSAGAAYGTFSRKELLPATEEYPAEPQNDYAKSKLIAEDLLLGNAEREDIWVTVMRLGAIYGPRSRYGMANGIIMQLLGVLEPMIVGGKNRAALIHAWDTVAVAMFLADQDAARGEIFNVHDGCSPTMAAVSRAQGRAAGIYMLDTHMSADNLAKSMVEPLERMSKQMGIDPIIDVELARMTALNAHISVEKLRSLCEQAGTSLTAILRYPNTLQGLAETVEWYRTEGRKEGYLSV